LFDLRLHSNIVPFFPFFPQAKVQLAAMSSFISILNSLDGNAIVLQEYLPLIMQQIQQATTRFGVKNSILLTDLIAVLVTTFPDSFCNSDFTGIASIDQAYND
jgi:hypothetical protein